MAEKQSNRGIITTSILLDLVIVALFLFLPRSGMEEMAAVFVLLPLCVVRIVIAVIALIRGLRRGATLLALYTVCALLLLAGLGYLSANLGPSYDPLHRALRAEARVQARRFGDFVDRSVYDLRRARQRSAHADHAQLCDALTLAQNLDAMGTLLRETVNSPCVTYFGEAAPPLLHLILHTYGPWTGGELARRNADEDFVAPAAGHLLAAGADPNAQDANGNTALHYALIFRNEALLDALLEHNACLLLKNRLGESPLSTHSASQLRRKMEAAEQDPEMLTHCPDDVLPDGIELTDPESDASPSNANYDLLQALRSGRLELAIAAFERGADPDAADHEGTSFEAALRNCRSNSASMAQLLLDAGADVGRRNRTGETALLVAMRYCSDAIPLLLANGADPSVGDNRGNTALHELGRIKPEQLEELLEQLLDAGADINQQNRAGQTPLMKALYGSSSATAIVEALLGRGADPNRTNASGNSALHLLAVRKNDPLALIRLEALLAAEPQLELRNPRQETPLVAAVMRGAPEAARKLIDAGANIHVKRERGTPLISSLISCKPQKLTKLKLLIAAGARLDEGIPHGALPLAQALYNKLYLDCLDPAQLLLQAGADPAQKDQNGSPPIHSLAFWQDKDPAAALELLARHDAAIDERNAQGLTTLLLAARSGSSIRTMERLIASGADPAARDDRGNTLLHCAAINTKPGNTERLAWVLARGGDPQAVNSLGETPLDRARATGNLALAAELSAL
ncbi:MAG: ankyrin repeat domain-containing protein [Pseudomonadota bacterium]